MRFACYLADYFIIGYDILRKAAKGIKNRQVFDESFLMAVATVGAMALAIYENGKYLEAIAVMLFYQIGQWFQGYAVGRSRRNISNLMGRFTRTKYVVFDKTGTMTKEVFEVNGIYHSTIENDKLLEYAALAESASSYPIYGCNKIECHVWRIK